MALDQLDLQDNFGLASSRFSAKKQELDITGLESMDLEIAEYESFDTSNLRVHIMAGAAAGMLEHCVMYPVDSIKTRMQSLRPDPNAIYRGVTDAFGKIFRYEGFFRPFRGLNVVAVGAGPAHALYFSSYEAMKKMLGNGGQGHHPLANGVAGATATIFHDGAMNPVEVVKQRMQMYNSPYRGVRHCFQSILANEGAKAFYRSFTTQLTMNIPFQCTHFITYEFFRETLNPGGGYHPRTHLIAGATAGGVAAALTTPLDVAKTLLNTQEKCAVAEMKSVTCGETRTFITGMFGALRTVYRLQGFRGFFQGLKARVIYQTPSCAISWSVYEFFKHFLTLTPDQEKEWMENAI